jgi:hypothetical protein
MSSIFDRLLSVDAANLILVDSKFGVRKLRSTIETRLVQYFAMFLVAKFNILIPLNRLRSLEIIEFPGHPNDWWN